jgi:inorganic pyrophosphatase
MIPTLYGFIPQTLCGEKIANNASSKSDGKAIRGDGDPLDICVLCERSVTHGDILLQAIPVGGFRLLDGDEADDKIIAVMKGDEFYHQWRDITDCPESYINRLKHYFLTYKNLPHEESVCKITEIYGREEAHKVINLALADYQDEYGEFHQ